jgi:hypothetical protein
VHRTQGLYDTINIFHYINWGLAVCWYNYIACESLVLGPHLVINAIMEQICYSVQKGLPFLTRKYSKSVSLEINILVLFKKPKSIMRRDNPQFGISELHESLLKITVWFSLLFSNTLRTHWKQPMLRLPIVYRFYWGNGYRF